MKYRLILTLFVLPLALFAQLSVAPVFTDHMVLQRNKPIKIWGKANPNEKILVEWNGEIKITRCTSDSNWLVAFPAEKASTKARSIRIQSNTSSLMIKDIVLGDVWLCIGQSNMEWPMQKEKYFKEEIPSANNLLMRFLNPSYAGKNIYNNSFTDSVVRRLDPSRFYQGSWEICDSNSFRNMSAVAYYFGKSIIAEKNIPIGLINISIGGAPLETFIDTRALANHPVFRSKVQGDWLKNNTLPVWVRERGMQNVGSLAKVPQDALGKAHGYKPGFAYKAGIEPIVNFSIAGILNYQGESNAQEIERVQEYADLTVLMVNDLRKKFKDPELPYYFVQLSSIDTLKYKGQLWPAFREEQRTILNKLAYSGMAVTTDVGAEHDVHPTNKKIVGERLSRWALNKIPSGPLPVKAVWKNGMINISFSYVADGLTTLDRQELRGFSINGKTENTAIILADKKTVQLKCVTKPSMIYYSWKSFSDANLCNSEMLPASTFMIPVQ